MRFDTDPVVPIIGKKSLYLRTVIADTVFLNVLPKGKLYIN